MYYGYSSRLPESIDFVGKEKTEPIPLNYHNIESIYFYLNNWISSLGTYWFGEDFENIFLKILNNHVDFNSVSFLFLDILEYLESSFSVAGLYLR